jgi:hypothetical protein
MPHVFISYSHADHDFVSRLASALTSYGVDVWMDDKDIQVGDSIIAAVEEGLRGADAVCLVLSQTSIEAPWVRREYRTALSLQLKAPEGSPRILPLRIDPVDPPMLLTDVRYADFVSGFDVGMSQLRKALRLSASAAAQEGPYVSQSSRLQRTIALGEGVPSFRNACV